MFIATTLVLYFLGGFLISKSNDVAEEKLDDVANFVSAVLWPAIVFHILVLDLI